MTRQKAVRALRAGATIMRRGFTGWFLLQPDGQRENINGLLVVTLINRCVVERIDDRTSAVGEEYGIAKEKHQ
jgi:hypothetical protein